MYKGCPKGMVPNDIPNAYPYRVSLGTTKTAGALPDPMWHAVAPAAALRHPARTQWAAPPAGRPG